MWGIVQAVFGIGLDFHRIVAAFLQVNCKCAIGAGGVGADQGIVQSADLKRTVADAFSAVLIFLDKLKAARRCVIEGQCLGIIWLMTTVCVRVSSSMV